MFYQPSRKLHLSLQNRQLKGVLQIEKEEKYPSNGTDVQDQKEKGRMGSEVWEHVEGKEAMNDLWGGEAERPHSVSRIFYNMGTIQGFTWKIQDKYFYSVSKYLMSISYVPETVLVTVHAMINMAVDREAQPHCAQSHGEKMYKEKGVTQAVS